MFVVEKLYFKQNLISCSDVLFCSTKDICFQRKNFLLCFKFFPTFKVKSMNAIAEHFPCPLTNYSLLHRTSLPNKIAHAPEGCKNFMPTMPGEGGSFSRKRSWNLFSTKQLMLKILSCFFVI